MSGEREPLLGRAARQHTDSPRPLGSIRLRLPGKMRDLFRSICTVETVKDRFPISRWLPKYSVQWLINDFIAGTTVALTVIPQGLAYAKIARLPPQYGLYSAFMGCFVYTFLGTSKDITLGPTAIMSLMTATFAVSPVENDPTYAIILTLMCGAVQFAMGVFQLGILVNFISFPVINAFTSAAAITIAFGQVKGILGLQNIPRDFIPMVYETCKHIPETKIWDMTMGLCCLVILFLLKKLRTIQWKDRPEDFPISLKKRAARKVLWLIGTGANALIVISAAGIAAALKSNGIDELSLTGHLRSGLPPFKVPDFTLATGNGTSKSGGEILSDIGPGLGIVPILGLVEAIAIGKAFARQNNYKIIPNQELIAIGVANMISSFVSSYPVTGSFSRTAVNSQSGVKTPAAGIVTGAIVLLALQLLTPLFYYIPKAALSAVIISAVIQMVDYRIIVTLWKVQKLDLVPLFVTFISSLAVGIEWGILIGIGVSLLILLYPIARPTIQTDYLDSVVVKFDQGLKFPSVEYVQARITEEMMSGDKPKSVILDCSHLSGIDYTTIQGMMELTADFRRQDVIFILSGVQPAILEELQDAGIPDLQHTSTVEEAVKLMKSKNGLQKGDELNSIQSDDKAASLNNTDHHVVHL